MITKYTHVPDVFAPVPDLQSHHRLVTAQVTLETDVGGRPTAILEASTQVVTIRVREGVILWNGDCAEHGVYDVKHLTPHLQLSAGPERDVERNVVE